MLTMTEFKTQAVKTMQERYPNMVVVPSVEEYEKKTVTKIMLKPRREITADRMYECSNLLLENMYDVYLKSESMGYVMEKVYEQMDALVEHLEKEKSPLVLSKQLLLDSVILQLMNTKYNVEKLKYIPHYIWNDLAVIPRIVLACNDERIVSAILLKKDMENAGLTLMEVMKAAVKNMEKIMGPYIVRSMNDVLGDTGCTVLELGEHNMEVVSNKYNRFGASALLFPKVFQIIAKKYDSDLIIIPSSVHELIVIPVTEKDAVNDPNDMVKSVNEEYVPLHEILSDHVYYYIRKNNQIIMHMEV